MFGEDGIVYFGDGGDQVILRMYDIQYQTDALGYNEITGKLTGEVGGQWVFEIPVDDIPQKLKNVINPVIFDTSTVYPDVESEFIPLE